MKVCILSDLNSYEGIGVYAQEIYQRLRITYDLDYLYLNYPTRSLVKDPNGDNIVLLRLKSLPFDSKPFFWLRVKKYLPNYDLYHIASQNLAFLGKGKTFILTVHDLLPLATPGPFWQNPIRRYLYSGISHARHIVTVSEYSKREIERLYGPLKNRITVIYEGVSDSFKPLEKGQCRQHFGFLPQNKYILHIGVDKWRKNVAGVVRTFARLRQFVPDSFLIRIGKNSNQTEKLIKKLRLEKSVINYSCLDLRELVAMYNACDVFLFPSFYEGFGLPVLEAMACGLPVVASRRSSIPEVTGNCAELVDPKDEGQITRALERILNNTELAQRMSQLGLTRSTIFRWENTAEATAQIYRNAL
ncbi:MAG: hypothetical protein A2142_07170 [candidate division Zixibacteria bacterium RBG_16_48_11]|nr:MAG: hypothetical protein A2142_07170 [candidate division Zixibacteria bacterium RBG_16_48_11]